MIWICLACLALLLGAHYVLLTATRRLNPKARCAEIQNAAGSCVDTDKKYRRQELPETDASAYVAMARCFVGKQTLKEENKEETL